MRQIISAIALILSLLVLTGFINVASAINVTWDYPPEPQPDRAKTIVYCQPMGGQVLRGETAAPNIMTFNLGSIPGCLVEMQTVDLWAVAANADETITSLPSNILRFQYPSAPETLYIFSRPNNFNLMCN